MHASGQKILRGAALVMGLSLGAKATALLRDIVLAAEFGTSREVDAFLVAGTIVGILLVWFRNPIQVVLVPLISQEVVKGGERSAWESGSVVMNNCLVLLLLVSSIGWLLSPYLVWLVAPGFADDTKRLSADLTGRLMLCVVLLGLSKLLSAFLHSYRRFGWPAATSAMENLVVIGSVLVLTPSLGIYGLVVGMVLGALGQVLMQASALWKDRWLYRFRLDFKHPTLRRMVVMSGPMLIGTGGDEVVKVSDRILASLLPSGSLAALSYALRLTYTTAGLFITSLTTVLFPFFSKTAGVGNYQDLEKKLFGSLRVLFWVVVPLSVGISLLHEPLVRLVFGRGAFGEESVRFTGEAVLFYGIGLSAYGLSNVLSYAFYSLQDTKTPVVMGLVRLGVKVPLSLALVKPMAHAGLALAESLSWVVKAVLLLWSLPLELRQGEYRKALRSFGVTTTITGPMGLVVFFALPYFEKALDVGASVLGSCMRLGAIAMLGGGTYLVLSLLLQPTELRDLYRLLRAGFTRG